MSAETVKGAAAQWNAKHPVGTPVRYWPGMRVGEGRVSKTRGEALVLGGHTAVVSVEGFPGGVSLSHVEPIEPEVSR